jgi:hypothetical protein
MFRKKYVIRIYDSALDEWRDPVIPYTFRWRWVAEHRLRELEWYRKRMGFIRWSHVLLTVED